MMNDLDERLNTYPEWQLAQPQVDRPQRLRREFRFKDFAEALAFVNKVGTIAERLNHHPLITFTWGRAILEVWSHDVGAITERDFSLLDALARGVNREV